MIPHLHPHAGDCEHACCLKIEHLSVHIGGETILDNIDLHMHCGQMVALIGPNGAGKSTLIRAILGQREYEGKITFHEASGKEAKLRIGYVPQSPAFDRGDPVSVMDLFTCCIFKRPAFLRPTKAMREKVLACLANVHGEALIDKRIGTLSGGELQRVLADRQAQRVAWFFMIALHQHFGFGAQRIEEVERAVQELSAEYGELREVDEVVADERVRRCVSRIMGHEVGYLYEDTYPTRAADLDESVFAATRIGESLFC